MASHRHLPHKGHGLGTSPHLDLKFFEHAVDQRRQELSPNHLLHEQRVERVRRHGLLHLRVNRHVLSHRHIGIGIHIHMCEPLVAAEDRHLRLFDHGFAEAGPATRDNRIETFAGPDQLDRHLFFRTFDDDPCAGRHAILFRGCAQSGRDSLLRQGPLRRATKHTEVARFKTERDRFHRNERAQFRHHADHADRDADTADLQSVRPFPS